MRPRLPLFPHPVHRQDNPLPAPAPLPSEASSEAFGTASRVLAIATEELPITGQLPETDRTRFVWRVAGEVDATLAEAVDGVLSLERERIGREVAREYRGRAIIVAVVVALAGVAIWLVGRAA